MKTELWKRAVRGKIPYWEIMFYGHSLCDKITLKVWLAIKKRRKWNLKAGNQIPIKYKER
jgi:hypothetical protein